MCLEEFTSFFRKRKPLRRVASDINSTFVFGHHSIIRINIANSITRLLHDGDMVLLKISNGKSTLYYTGEIEHVKSQYIYVNILDELEFNPERIEFVQKL